MVGFSVQWHAYGHMITCLIAQENLKETNKEALNWALNLLSNFQKFTKSKNFTFVEACVWADDLKANRLDAFSPMHYIDYEFSADGSKVGMPEKINSVWML